MNQIDNLSRRGDNQDDSELARRHACVDALDASSSLESALPVIVKGRASPARIEIGTLSRRRLKHLAIPLLQHASF